MGSLHAKGGSKSSAFLMQPAGRLPLTDECHHYTEKDQLPENIQNYFSQRYSIFSLYDKGIYMTNDAWFGVTPEPIANQIAYEFEQEEDSPRRVLIDCFAGAGGNSIPFNLSPRFDRIIAIEQDAPTLACAQHNAAIYHSVHNQTHDEASSPPVRDITWVHGDSFQYLDLLLHNPEKLHPDLRVDPKDAVVFASPPWGGPGYRTDKVFDLHTMQPYTLLDLHGAYKTMDHILYLPRTSDIRQIARLAPEWRKIEVTQYCMEGASKAMGAYILREESR